MEIWTFDEGILLDENCRAIACTWECEAATERNMRQLQSAPEMYELISEALQRCKGYSVFADLHDRATELLARIDGEVEYE